MLSKIERVVFQLTVLLALACSAEPAGARDASVPPIIVEGRVIREPAILEHGRLFVPVRGFFEAFDARVAYTPPRIVVVRKNGSVIAGIVVNRQHALVGNRARNLPAAPIRRGGRVYVPLRVIAEIAGAWVTYSSHPRLVEIHVPSQDPVAAAVAEPVLPDDDTPPAWGLALVGVIFGAFALELLRRFAIALNPNRRARRDRLGLGSHALQLAHAAGSGDNHPVGKIAE